MPELNVKKHRSIHSEENTGLKIGPFHDNVSPPFWPHIYTYQYSFVIDKIFSQFAWIHNNSLDQTTVWHNVI